MAEPRGPGSPEPPPDRLQRWFATEVRAAERDIKRGLVGVPGTPGRRGLGRRALVGGLAGTTSAAILLAVALAAGYLGGAASPPPTAASGQPTATSGIVIGANGIPASIDGEPVLTPSAAITRALVSTDASTFLVGGWLDDSKAACPSTPPAPVPALLDTGICGGQPALLASPPVDEAAVDWNGRNLWIVFLDGASPPEPTPEDLLEPYGDAVVLRVHTHDPSAATCSADVRLQCDLAVVVNAVLWRASVGPIATVNPSSGTYGDGIPATLDGQPVLRPTQAVARADGSTDASTFLVGGWVETVYSYTGCAQPVGSEGDQVLTRTFCGTYLDETPTAATEGPLELHFRTSVSADWPGEGPVIVRVHTHDQLATTCAATNQDDCAHAVVVDALLWSGPGLGPDGLPSWMDGQSTISVPEAQSMLAQVPGSPAELEVRGWYAGWSLPCPYVPATVPPTPGSSLLPDRCQPSVLGPAPIPLGQDRATADDLDLTLGPGVEAPPPGAVVVELHGHDPTAGACDPSIRAACDAAVIVDRVVWTASTGVVNAAPSATPGPSPTDIPSSFDGRPVLRGEAIVDRVEQATDATPFLVGGWTPTTPEIYFCPMIPAPSPGSSLGGVILDLCGGLWFLDAPGDPQGILRGTPPWVALSIGVVTQPPPWDVPFIMQVHVALPQAQICPAGPAGCPRTIVEDALVWAGSPPAR
ncbi:MAG TPA: hypothetical protein VMH24_01430 [Candidatus Sulfotelmatobacter sp.]|nr:hypothetical protein [Candidatus Sulfotelmatobacter sp.]